MMLLQDAPEVSKARYSVLLVTHVTYRPYLVQHSERPRHLWNTAKKSWTSRNHRSKHCAVRYNELLTALTYRMLPNYCYGPVTLALWPNAPLLLELELVKTSNDMRKKGKVVGGSDRNNSSSLVSKLKLVRDGRSEKRAKAFTHLETLRWHVQAP